MLDLHSSVGKIAVSLVLGTAVGLERELSDKPAGLKTNVLICIGATLFTILSQRWPAAGGTNDAHIAAQIVSGIGFLGAGAIMRDGEQVTGLATAAIIWVMAAIGMAVGMGHHFLAGTATLATLAVQVGMSRLDSLVDALRQRLTFRIVTAPEQRAIETVAKTLKAHRIRIVRRKVMKRNNLYHSEWVTFGPPVSQYQAARELLRAADIIELTY